MAEGFSLIRYVDENVDTVGDHAGGESDHVGQVIGEGNREVVGLERLCREGRAGEKVRLDSKFISRIIFWLNFNIVWDLLGLITQRIWNMCSLLLFTKPQGIHFKRLLLARLPLSFFSHSHQVFSITT